MFRLSVWVILCYLSAFKVETASIQKRDAQSSQFAAAILERPGLLNFATRLHNIAGGILDRAQQNRPNNGFGPPPPGPPGHPGHFPPPPPEFQGHHPPPGFQGHHPPPPPPPPPNGGYPDWYGGHRYPAYGPPGYGPPGGHPPPGGPGWPPQGFGPPPPPPPHPHDPYGPHHDGNFPQPQPEDEDKKLISGYFDGTFPVILLDQENEVRR